MRELRLKLLKMDGNEKYMKYVKYLMRCDIKNLCIDSLRVFKVNSLNVQFFVKKAKKIFK